MTKSKPGTYVLILPSTIKKEIVIGKLGTFTLDIGCYVYVGSAFGPGGVRARISHHQKIATRPHWHIDYLRAYLSLADIWYSHDPCHREHQWSTILHDMPESSVPLHKFGSSDCNCDSHLYFFKDPPVYSVFCDTLYQKEPAHQPVHLLKNTPSWPKNLFEKPDSAAKPSHWRLF